MGIVGIIGIVVAIAVLLIGLIWLVVELKHRQRPGNDLAMTAGDWNLEVYESERYLLVGELELQNQTQSLEIMVPEVSAQAQLLSGGSLEDITHTITIEAKHPDEASRPDNYWFAYIVKVAKTTRLQVSIELKGPDLSQLRAIWVQIHYLTYGPEGRIPKVRHVVVPLKFPSVESKQTWRPTVQADVLPISTHLLTHLDNPVDVVKRYVAPHAQPGDIITIGETPLAIMQERLRHPSEIKPGWLAKRLCYYFMPTSSLATACGLQTLVDISGAWRVFFAFAMGAIAKIVGQPGMFYRLAGEQARLIDDVTGTLPPYDQFIVLGPHNPQQVVTQIQQETQLSAAIVDVNDLKAVKILAATPDLDPAVLKQALVSNPAGNADEQTPLVLVRPTKL